MGIFKKDDKVVPVEPEFKSEDEAVAAHDEQEQTPDAPVQAHEAEELDSVEQANKDRNEELGGSDGFFVSEPHRKKKETVAEYNARVPVGSQAVQPGPKTSYLGKPL